MPKRYGKGLRPAPIAAEKQQLGRKLRSDEDERMREELRNTAKCFHDAEAMSDEDFCTDDGIYREVGQRCCTD